MVQMRRYDLLSRHLAERPTSERSLILRFSEIEGLMGQRLPTVARMRQEWWLDGSGSLAFRAGGWKVISVDRDDKHVILVRIEPPPTGGQASGSHEARHRPGTAIVRNTIAGVVAIGAAAASEASGLTHLTWPWAIGLSGAVGAVAFAVSSALTPDKDSGNPLWWWRASAILMLVAITLAFAYHKSLDPALQRRTYHFVVNGSELNYIPLYGEAGGQPQNLATGAAGQNALIGGQTYSFDCWIFDRNGAKWLRYERFGQSWWAPRRELHPPFGQSEPPLPHC
jgi:hypothetical protein